MTNQKMSLGEKVGLGVAVGGFVGGLGFFSAVLYSANEMHQYKSLNEERAIVFEIEKLDNKPLVEDILIQEKYKAYKEAYSPSLEKRLQEIRASTQYVDERQNTERDNKSSNNYLLLELISFITGAMCLFYSISKKSQRLSQPAQPSGASK